MSSFIALYEQSAYMDLGLNAMVLSHKHIEQFEDVVDSGIVSFKFFMPYRVGTEPVKGLPQLDDGLMYLGFKKLGEMFEKGLRIHARIHCENVEIFSRIKEEFMEGGTSPKSWHQVRPSICEIEAIKRSLYLSQVTGCPITLIHMSTKESVDLIAHARREGIRVFGETCPQYLTLSVDKTDRNLSKVNPPIREEDDNRRLWEGIKGGVIDLVGTDHWPVYKSKKVDFWKGEVGLSIVECWLAILLSEGVNRGKISLEKLVEICCFNPARLLGLVPGKGMIEVGSDADLTIVDLGKEVTVGEKPVYSDTDFNIFAGWRLKGWPVLTMLRGKIVMDQGKICGHAGDGRFRRSKNH
jgi:dihydroorotase-like cyclic amidohydrolase